MSVEPMSSADALAYLRRGMCHEGEKRDACAHCQRRLAALSAVEKAISDAWQTGVDAEAHRTRRILAAADIEIRDGVVRELGS